MIKTKTLAFTYNDYLAYTEHSDKRYELVEGELNMVPSPSFQHQKVLGRLFTILNNYVLKNNIGELVIAPIDLYIDDISTLQPDIVFISKEKSYIIENNRINGSPDLVIEIISPSTVIRDRDIKKKLYARAEIMEYWIVEPDKKEVEVYNLSEEGYVLSGIHKNRLSSEIFAGLIINLSEIF